jgi:type IV pilus biogenesis/stability protein PilW
MRTVTARIGRVGVLLLALLVPILTGCAPRPEVRPPGEDRYRPDDHYRLAQSYIGNGSYLLAEQEIKQALALAPDDPRYLELLALIYQAQGRLQLAEGAYRHALQKAEPPPSVLVNYSTLLLLFGRIDEAISCIQRALRDPRYNRPALAYTNMGLAYFQKGAPLRAIEQFRIALEYQSNLPEAHYNLGLVYAQTGELDKAIRAFREAVRYRPSYVEAHASLGAVLLETGRQEEARAAFERVIALAPDSDMATASRQQLKHLTP